MPIARSLCLLITYSPVVATEAYKGHSSSIVDVLTDLKQKAEMQLDEARKEEINAKHNFDLLKQSLEELLGNRQ